MDRRAFFILVLGIALGLGLVLSSAVPALADVRELIPKDPAAAGVPAAVRSIYTIVDLIFNTLITIAGAIFMIMLLIGGITYLTSAGDEEGTAKAKRRLLDAIIGLVIVLAAWAIGNWVIDRLTGQNQPQQQQEAAANQGGVVGREEVRSFPKTRVAGEAIVSDSVRFKSWLNNHNIQLKTVCENTYKGIYKQGKVDLSSYDTQTGKPKKSATVTFHCYKK